MKQFFNIFFFGKLKQIFLRKAEIAELIASNLF